MKITLKPRESKTTLFIDWDINYDCNYRCSYCTHYKTGWNKTSLDKAIKAFNKLYDSVLKNSSFPIIIWFSGGEPSILPWFTDFCLYIKKVDSNIKLSMSTNGSQPFKLYDHLLDNNILHSIVFSLHFEFAKPEHFLKKIMLLYDKYSQVDRGLEKFSVVVMYEKQATELASKIMEELKEKNIKTSTHLLRNESCEKSKDFVLKTYNSNLQDVSLNDAIFYNSNYIIDLMNVNNFSFKGWTCWVGVHRFFISKEFNLFAGSCGIKSFGNLLTDNIKFDNQPVICDGRSCICTANIKVKKEIEYNKTVKIFK
jgi:MoaA/NifB/PqqE/SkfB family radical SAM enzyme